MKTVQVLLKLNIAFMFIVSFLFTQLPSYGQSQEPMLGEYYKEEGPFVSGPAYLGASLGFALGFIVAFPVSILYDRLTSSPEKGGQLFVNLVYYPTATLAHIVGFPFFLIKKIFYDGPKYLLEKVSS